MLTKAVRTCLMNLKCFPNNYSFDGNIFIFFPGRNMQSLFLRIFVQVGMAYAKLLSRHFWLILVNDVILWWFQLFILLRLILTPTDSRVKLWRGKYKHLSEINGLIVAFLILSVSENEVNINVDKIFTYTFACSSLQNVF